MTGSASSSKAKPTSIGRSSALKGELFIYLSHGYSERERKDKVVSFDLPATGRSYVAPAQSPSCSYSIRTKFSSKSLFLWFDRLLISIFRPSSFIAAFSSRASPSQIPPPSVSPPSNPPSRKRLISNDSDSSDSIVSVPNPSPAKKPRTSSSQKGQHSSSTLLRRLCRSAAPFPSDLEPLIRLFVSHSHSQSFTWYPRRFSAELDLSVSVETSLVRAQSEGGWDDRSGGGRTFELLRIPKVLT